MPDPRLLPLLDLLAANIAAAVIAERATDAGTRPATPRSSAMTTDERLRSAGEGPSTHRGHDG